MAKSRAFQRVGRRLRVAAAAAGVLAAAALTISCGPTLPEETAWIYVAPLPEGVEYPSYIEATAATRERLLVLSISHSEKNESVLWEYTPSKGYKRIFSIRGNFDQRRLYALTYEPASETSWLGGYDNAGTKEEPLYRPLVLRDGGSGWELLDIPAWFNGQVYELVTAGPDACWILLDVATEYPDRYLVRYSAGTFTEYRELGEAVGGRNSLYGRTLARDPASGWTYFVPAYSLDWYITGDEGATWRRERIAVDTGGRNLRWIVNVTPRGRECYFIVLGELDSYAIVKRTGLPGQGKYELMFYHYQGPGLGQLREMAFARDGRGLAAGYDASFVLDGDYWREEALPPNMYDGARHICAAPERGFYGFGPAGLMYHPGTAE